MPVLMILGCPGFMFGTGGSALIAKKLGETTLGAETVVFLHYPPSFGGIVCRQLVDVMHEYGVKRCFYGHIHSVNPAIPDRFAADIPIYCISADLIGFKPMKLNKFQAV